jgi:predicted N-formylglutamate amidohydrolase
MTPHGLLAPDEPAPSRLIGADTQGRALLICDHASSRIPQSLAGLGLPVEAMARHIAWDIGAGAVTKALSERLTTPAFLANYSRLVVDCNRALTAADLITTDGDGHWIGGNEALDPVGRDLRVTVIHQPYHAALSALIDRLAHSGPVALIAIHSFTPVFRRRARPWVAGVLYGDDDRLAIPLLEALRQQKDGAIGDNEPYSGRYPGAYTLHRHGSARLIPHVSLEIRQDELVTPHGVRRWADRLARALRPLLGTAGISP